MSVGHFHNKNTQFYGYRLFSDVKITPFFLTFFFGLHLKFYSQISNCTTAKAQTFRKRQDQNILTLQHTSVPFHKQKQNVKIVTFYHVLTPAPHGPTLKQKSGHTKRVITSNCTKFLKYTHKILLLEIMQNASSTTRYFF